MAPILAATDIEGIVFVILAIFWGVANLIARAAKSGKTKRGIPGAAPARRPPVRPAGGSSAGDELRRFLEEITGVKMESEAPPPPVPAPAFRPPPVQAPAGRKPGRRPSPAFAQQAEPTEPFEHGTREIGVAAIPMAADLSVASKTIRSRTSFTPHIQLPTLAIRGVSVGAVAGMRMSSGTGEAHRSSVDLSFTNREAMKKAILYRAIIGPCRALHEIESDRF